MTDGAAPPPGRGRRASVPGVAGPGACARAAAGWLGAPLLAFCPVAVQCGERAVRPRGPGARCCHAGRLPTHRSASMCGGMFRAGTCNAMLFKAYTCGCSRGDMKRRSCRHHTLPRRPFHHGDAAVAAEGLYQLWDARAHQLRLYICLSLTISYRSHRSVVPDKRTHCAQHTFISTHSAPDRPALVNGNCAMSASDLPPLEAALDVTSVILKQ